MQALVHPRFIMTPDQDSTEAGRLILRDGSTAQVRPAQQADSVELIRFFNELSAESRYRRFLSATLPGRDLVDSLLHQSAARTLVVTRIVCGKGRIIATGSYLVRDVQSAELALAVADEFRGKGVGTLLLERLAILAAREGIVRFWVLTSLENEPMLDVLRASGFDLQGHTGRGWAEFDLTLTPTSASVEQHDTRDRIATVASLRPFFHPKAVAVIGASLDPAAIGRGVLDNLVRSGYAGPIYPVNPRVAEVSGLRVYPSVRDLPPRVDLAVIAVPAGCVSGVVEECAERGIRVLVVISAGFAEVGGDGADLQQALVEQVRGYGMRMVGPNCLGLINADPAICLNASFSPVFPPPGRIAMSSQSGAVGLAALGAATRYGLGFSTFVSVGNKADVSGNDLLQYWEEDPATAVILLYLESFGNPRRFSRIARRVGRRKPVVVLHSGLTRAGGRAAGSHTAALASNATAAEALFAQTGVVRAGSLEEMFDLALLLGNQPLPRGRRVAIVTNAGGPGILASDACEAGGLVVPEPSPGLRAKLNELLPGAASTGNPVDLIAAAGAEPFRRAVEAMIRSGEFDALLAIFTPIGNATSDEVARAILDAVAAARAAGAIERTVLACILGQEVHRAYLDSPSGRIPCYPFPETPARVLAKAAAHAAWRDQPTEIFSDFTNLDLGTARSICRKAAAEPGVGWLGAEELRKVLGVVGLPQVVAEFARTADSAASAADKIGYPVAVKLASRRFVHKTEVAGIRLGLTSAADVRRAFDGIHERVEREGGPEAMDGVIVQSMVRCGVEVMVGVTQDPLFGPLVAFGLGGIHVEVLSDVCFRVAPLSDRDAAQMVRGIRGFKLLEGYRGHPAADCKAIEEVLLRVSRLAEEVPEISEIDLNPIFAFPPGEGCAIADARIRIRPVQSISPALATR